MGFTPGRQKTGGRQPGTPNKLTGTFREAVRVVYDGLGGHAAFLVWARENPGDFYRLAARLIPAESEGEADAPKVIILRRFTPLPEERRALPGEDADASR